MDGLTRALASFLPLFLWSPALRAVEGAADAAPRGRVELVSAPDSADVRLFDAALRDLLAARGLELTFRSQDVISPQELAVAVAVAGDAAPVAAATPEVVSRIWLDVAAPRGNTTPDRATLTLTDARRRRVFVRRVPLARGFDAVAREGVLFVVESSVEAILAGREIGVSRDEYQRALAAASAPAAAVTPPPSVPISTAAGHPPSLVLTVGYAAAAMVSDVLAHGPTIALDLHWSRWRVGAGFHVSAPVRVGNDAATATLTTGRGQASVAARLLSAGGLSLLAGAGAALDATRIHPSVSTSQLRPTATFWASSPSLRGFLEVDWALGGRLSLALAVGGDVYPLPERYLVSGPTGRNTVFVPNQVRPSAALGLGVRL